MAAHSTHKSGRKGKAQTLAHRKARSIKQGATVTNKSGRGVR